MCTPDAVASVESTIAVFVALIADASPDTMLSVSTLPSSDGSMAAMLSELPRMSTGVDTDLGDVGQLWIRGEQRRRRRRC